LAARDACHKHPDARVRVAVNASAGRLCRPLAQRRQPATLQDAKYSIPFMTAYVLVHGAPTLNGLSPRVLRDARVLDMAARIDLEDGLPDNPGHPQARLALMENGRVLREFRFQAEDLNVDEGHARAKFDDCMAQAGREAGASAIWDAAMQGRLRSAFDLACEGNEHV
jgi:hypothetical protein